MTECIIPSPFGSILICANSQGITAIRLLSSEVALASPTSALLKEAAKQLENYFLGALQHFSIPLAPAGTAFQQQVWQALRQIPFGATCSYQQIANAIGNPKAVRAVGMANSRNPVAIVIPCHRVIGANGQLTGYAGGLDKKAWLLQHEQQPGQTRC
ncbi:methylated-DNA--[protein]-cysteine S-methyltransferase [Alkalimonas amylolytica]|uniref:Methylated-DNA--protein-cysteine methyltransferase n=1 Tax=Alkalimonas amylolytica TaxID=152573 RepID=A0A1H4CN85_ALKAM|nr:methylated-DNA--[protein]-cysteine S-methyltransferase [Alkalimonas amylolytica]SEA61794.1 methylated-DNA-[protein]-cysteine S-methyltransferase [Alkalimonas amylolytica]